MSATEGAEVPKTTEEKEEKPLITSNVFSMFGGGAKKEKKDEDEDRGDVSGSNKAQRDAAAAAASSKKKEDDEDEVPESVDVHFEPVIHLTKEVKVMTHEESEECTFKMRAKLFKWSRDDNEWKERGTGEVRFLKHHETGRTRLVMRREKTLKVCANHYITPQMNLKPNIGSDRSWVWVVSADVSEGTAESMTLAIRFANSENAQLFKENFNKAQVEVEKLDEAGDATSTDKPSAEPEDKETAATEATEEKKETEEPAKDA